MTRMLVTSLMGLFVIAVALGHVVGSVLQGAVAVLGH